MRSGDKQQIKNGDASAAPRVLAYLLRLTGGSRSDAEDLTQETFLAAYAGRSDFGGSNPLAWLFGIARRRQRDAFRAASVRPQTVAGDVPEPATGGIAVDESVPRRVVLLDTLARLDDADRDVVLLVAVQGLTYTEAAAVIGEPVGTVKWRVHAATKRLRGVLSGSFAEYISLATDTRKEIAHVETV